MRQMSTLYQANISPSAIGLLAVIFNTHGYHYARFLKNALVMRTHLPDSLKREGSMSSSRPPSQFTIAYTYSLLLKPHLRD